MGVNPYEIRQILSKLIFWVDRYNPPRQKINYTIVLAWNMDDNDFYNKMAIISQTVLAQLVRKESLVLPVFNTSTTA